MFNFKRFLSDTSGNVAMTFGLSGLALLGAVGLSIDYMGTQDAQTSLQAQVDAAVLAVAISGAETDAERDAIVLGSMVENGYNPDVGLLTLEYGDGGTIRLVAEADYDVAVMGLFGYESVRINAAAESRTAEGSTIDLVMVLDTTESMDGSKMDTLKIAAGDLVDTVASFEGADVKVGLVPFSKYVNVGLSNRYESWIDVPADWTETKTHQPTIEISPKTCTGTETYIYHNDGVPETRTRQTGCTDAVKVNDGPPVAVTEDHDWRGCVGSRDTGNRHLTDKDYYSHRIPGLLDRSCADPLVPLTTKYEDVKDAIDDLDADYNTYMPAGVAWGRRVLSEIAPFSETDMSEDTLQVMIVMTDGMNSMRLDGNEHDSIDFGSSDADDEVEATNKDTLTLCESAKDEDGVQVYTVAFEVDDADTKAMLKNCASSPSHYFDATNNDSLISAFRNITSRLMNVRLTR